MDVLQWECGVGSTDVFVKLSPQFDVAVFFGSRVVVCLRHLRGHVERIHTFILIHTTTTAGYRYTYIYISLRGDTRMSGYLYALSSNERRDQHVGQFTSFLYPRGKIVQYTVSRYKQQQHRSIYSSLGKISASDTLTNVCRHLFVVITRKTCAPEGW